MTNRNKVEAVLFALGRDVSEEDVARLSEVSLEETKQHLAQLQQDYNDDHNNSLFIRHHDGFWKFTIKDPYLPLVSALVTHTELDKSVMETLAVIAWNHPALQADIIRIRNTKAYDHMKELQDAGFVAKEKYGRTFRIKLTPKFFDYFDIPSKNAKDAFKKVVPEEVQQQVLQMEDDIDRKEQEVEELLKVEEEQKAKVKEQLATEKTAEQEAEEAADELDKQLSLQESAGASDEGEENPDTDETPEQDAPPANGAGAETIYVCEGSCGGVVSEQEHEQGATTCGSESCEKHGQPLVPVLRCKTCKAQLTPGENHTCDN